MNTKKKSALVEQTNSGYRLIIYEDNKVVTSTIFDPDRLTDIVDCFSYLMSDLLFDVGPLIKPTDNKVIYIMHGPGPDCKSDVRQLDPISTLEH